MARLLEGKPVLFMGLWISDAIEMHNSCYRFFLENISINFTLLHLKDNCMVFFF